jgi:tRNA-dihydrouridine synthase C
MQMKTITKLYLAPMEGLGNFAFRNAIAIIGGFDEATREFISVPKNSHARSIAKKFDPKDTFPIPQAAQIMGSDIDTLARVTNELTKLNAPRIELNVGCPSNTVTGNGSGSSLLKDPNHLYKILHKMVRSTHVKVSAKLRSGYLDTSLFKENILAAEASGIAHLTLHARTKVDGYKGFSDLNLIKQAKELLKIPLIGNGDIKTCEDAYKMLAFTKCDGLMIGRGAVINPWIFHEIKGDREKENKEETIKYLEKYFLNIQSSPAKNQIGQIKGLFSFLFSKNSALLSLRRDMLCSREKNPEIFFKFWVEKLFTESCL